MANSGFDPIVADDWQTDDIRAALAAIPNPHRGKRRTTAILVGFAQADNTALDVIFVRSDTCARSIWYGETRANGKVKRGWRDVPEIAAAVKMIEKRALEWNDEQTLRIQTAARTERQRDIAISSVKAGTLLLSVAADKAQRGADRINAVKTLVALADPDTSAAAAMPVSGASVEQSMNFSELGDDDLRALLAKGRGEGTSGEGTGAPTAD